MLIKKGSRARKRTVSLHRSNIILIVCYSKIPVSTCVDTGTNNKPLSKLRFCKSSKLGESWFGEAHHDIANLAN